MSEQKVPRDKKVCFWCRFLDHSEPACHKNAPIPVWDPNDTAFPTAVWPFVRPHADWCAQFEEGDADKLTVREPQATDETYDLRVFE